jgi:prolyl 4-hydroxylase
METPCPDVQRVNLSFVPARLRASVVFTIASPHVVLFADLLSARECDQLIELATPRLARSTTINGATGLIQTHRARTSDGMFFRLRENDLVRSVERRIAALLNWPLENGEGLQILRYQEGSEYKPHFDFFMPGRPATPRFLERGGQRVATVIMYLNTPKTGGETVFPNINLKIPARRGHALFFSYVAPDPSRHTLHAGAPVVAGEKWVATKWLRERVCM